MLVHKKKRPRYQIQAPLTSLIDIVFMLLIYFLLTTNFMVDEGIKIKLPQASASTPQTEKEITIYVDRQGNAYLDNKKVALNVLFTEVKKRIGRNRNKLVVVKADRGVVVNKMVKVMDVAKSAGAGRLCLATEKELE
ncbi:MAG: biopolymer transporter ExbD [Thermodesulfobacteriota bacterium]|nr:biopolymer transporter ExbD [Thermodesulfobacteriota bacterium]